MFETIDELNLTALKKHDADNLALGIYSYEVNAKDDKLVFNDSYPCIKLTNDYKVFTFAHECGHHLAIKNFKDTDESVADHFILLLAEEYLTNLERYIISIALKVYADAIFPLPKIKLRDWKKFKKEHNL
jgi:hypothetical protein